MPKIRSLKADYFKSEDVSIGGPDRWPLSAVVKTLGAGLICCMADDEGRCKASTTDIKAEVFRHDSVTEEQIGEALTVLDRSGVIQLYSSDKRPYIQILNWETHQYIPPKRRQPSRIATAPTRRVHGARTTRAVQTHGTDSEGAIQAHGANTVGAVSRAGSRIPIPIPILSPLSSSNEKDDVNDEKPTRARLAAITQVRALHDAWVQATGRTTRAELTEDRIRQWRGARKVYSQGDVLDAARGIRLDPYYMGQNKDGRPYNEVNNVCKPANLERFRDLERGVLKPTLEVAASNGASIAEWVASREAQL